MTRRMINRRLWHTYAYDEWSLKEFARIFSDLAEQAPNDTMVRFDADEYTASLNVEYDSEETDDEYSKRMETEARGRQESRRRELEELRRLQEKYPDRASMEDQT